MCDGVLCERCVILIMRGFVKCLNLFVCCAISDQDATCTVVDVCMCVCCVFVSWLPAKNDFVKTLAKLSIFEDEKLGFSLKAEKIHNRGAPVEVFRKEVEWNSRQERQIGALIFRRRVSKDSPWPKETIISKGENSIEEKYQHPLAKAKVFKESSMR